MRQSIINRLTIKYQIFEEIILKSEADRVSLNQLKPTKSIYSNRIRIEVFENGAESEPKFEKKSVTHITTAFGSWDMDLIIPVDPPCFSVLFFFAVFHRLCF